MERRWGWVGSAHDGQANPRVTCDGWTATVPHLGVPAPVLVGLLQACTGTRNELRPRDVPFVQ
jgi:hypothetical protein